MEAVETVETSKAESQNQVGAFAIPWKLDENYSGDRIIKEYFSGKPEAMSAEKAMLLEKIDSEIRKITLAAEELLSHLNEIGVKVYNVFLKFCSLGDYDMLVIVDEASFEIDELISKSYRKSCDIRKSVREPYFSLGISFVEKTEDFDRDLVVSDGYGIIYANEKQTIEASEAQ